MTNFKGKNHVRIYNKNIISPVFLCECQVSQLGVNILKVFGKILQPSVHLVSAIQEGVKY